MRCLELMLPEVVQTILVAFLKMWEPLLSFKLLTALHLSAIQREQKLPLGRLFARKHTTQKHPP